MSVELFNRTKYNDEKLTKVLELAAKLAGFQGDVAVIVRYHANSTGSLGTAFPSFPYFNKIGLGLKKFAHKQHQVVVNTSSSFSRKIVSATKDADFGYIQVRVPKPNKFNTKFHSEDTFDTMLHEMLHIWQYRNKNRAIELAGIPDWKTFRGYGSGNSRRASSSDRPIEKQVKSMIKEIMDTEKKNKRYQKAIETLTSEFSGEKAEKIKKSKQSVKYNKFGERMSDYRNVKMNKLRNGDLIIRCPHCGEKAVILDQHKYDANPTYTHIASYDSEMQRYHEFSASESRDTQFGHVQDREGNWVNVTWGYEDLQGNRSLEETDVLKTFNFNPYGRW